MKITIDTEICKREGLSFEDTLFLLLVKTTKSIKNLTNNLLKKEAIIIDLENPKEFLITKNWSEKVDLILLDSESKNKNFTEEVYIDLAKKLMDIFPKGKKEGTSLYWKGNVKDTVLRLKKFFKLYGNDFSTEKLLSATRNYVDSFNGNYSKMRVLKYFIWKDEKKLNSNGQIYVEETSDLASFLENEDQEDTNKDWTSELI